MWGPGHLVKVPGPGLLFELQPRKAECKSGAEDGGDFVKAILDRFQQGLQGSLVA